MFWGCFEVHRRTGWTVERSWQEQQGDPAQQEQKGIKERQWATRQVGYVDSRGEQEKFEYFLRNEFCRREGGEKKLTEILR